MIAVLDTGGISALAPVDEKARARLRHVQEHVADLVVPAGVLAEGLLTGHVGRDYHVRELLKEASVWNVDEFVGHLAGRLRVGAIDDGVDPPPSGVDAIVAAVADLAGDDVQMITSDPDDMRALLAHADHAGRVTLLPA